MIHIVGGAYVEYCAEPPWDQLFGSGGRAAVALTQLSQRVLLTTYVGDADRATLEYLSAVFKFSASAEPIPNTIHFYYRHGLSKPTLTPDPLVIDPAAPLMVEAPCVLRFGFIEGDAVVRGERVVYDPQDGNAPKPYRENGSTAARLAVVANVAECVKLAGGKVTGDDPESLGKAVLEAEGADTVVVKRGVVGALVVTHDEVRSVPAYRTPGVWPIGSGDVFSSVFAHHWAEAGVDAFTAAEFASLSTAFYCETKSFTIPTNLTEVFTPAVSTIGPGGFPSSPKRVYLAGPFFTMAQRWLIDETMACLREQGFIVFSPLHDVGYGPADVVVPADLDALDKSDIVFAILDGLDAGTLFEVGYARSAGKPVVAFVQNEGQGNLKMIAGAGCEVVRDFASAIYRAAWVAMAL